MGWEVKEKQENGVGSSKEPAETHKISVHRIEHKTCVESDRYEVAHGNTWDGKLRRNKRMEWDPVSSQLKHTTFLYTESNTKPM